MSAPTDAKQEEPEGLNDDNLQNQDQALLQQIQILQTRVANPALSTQRIVPVGQSRIVSGPKDDKDSTLKIKVWLDLEVEVDLYARNKGDVTIGFT